MVISARSFYATYNGHDPEHLDLALRELRFGADGLSERRAIFLAGDSSLDNKVWFEDTAPACDWLGALEGGK